MAFMKAIGKHVKESGLKKCWTEYKMLGSGTADQVINSLSYTRCMRAHKITLQVLWRLIIPKMQPELPIELEELSKANNVDELIKLIDREFEVIRLFFKDQTDPNTKYWWSYMEMVHILLLFTRAQREGNWSLHINAFAAMLPYFAVYNHTN